jgi:hypothetical protein
MRSVYVRNLIALLKFLGRDQQAIAKRLKVSKATVSMWSTGKRPVTHRHMVTLHAFAMQVMQDDHSATMRELEALQVGANDAPRAEQERRLTRVAECEAHEQRILAYIDAWYLELYVTVGEFAEEVQAQLAVLGSPYAKSDPRTLTRDERQRLRSACMTLVRHFDYLDQFETARPHKANSAPTTYLKEVGRWCGITKEEE